MSMGGRIRIARGTAENLSALIPEKGQIVFEKNTGYVKVGDGVNTCSVLDPIRATPGTLGDAIAIEEWSIPFSVGDLVVNGTLYVKDIIFLQETLE